MKSKIESPSSPGRDQRPGDQAGAVGESDVDDVAADADWRQLEDFIEQLHALSRAPIEAEAFYQRLLEGCVTLLAAKGGAVWLPAGRGRWQATHRINSAQVLDASSAGPQAAHAALLQKAAATAKPLIVPPQSRGADGAENHAPVVLAMAAVMAAVTDASGSDRGARAEAIVELFLQPGSSPATEQGWQELLVTVCQVANAFHEQEQLRRLRAERRFYDQALAMMQRFQRSRSLQQTAFEIVNEGRRLLAADRLSLIFRQGKAWQLLATSGVDQIDTRSDAAKRLQQLAAATADWGEPLETGDSGATPVRDSETGEPETGVPETGVPETGVPETGVPETGVPETGVSDAWSTEATELPPQLAELLAQHIDESHARRLVAVPIDFVEARDRESSCPGGRSRVAAVLIAEQFDNEANRLSRQRVLELASLCEPALWQSQQLDRFAVRYCLRWSDRGAQVCQAWGLTRLTVAAAAAIALLAALVFVPCDFEVQAPATLRPRVERDIFAASDGNVVEVKIVHGQQVEAGEVLAVLHDPQLLLDAQRVRGEIDTTRKRLEAIAVARTDRKVREETSSETLPLSAEAEQLKQLLTSLAIQQEILASRREALTLRSPIAGQVLTLDVQNLLLTRPVERGQLLFTVADTTSGWLLTAELPQDRIGHVVAAQRASGVRLPARFRLVGESEQTYVGHVESISTAAVLDPAELDQVAPPFEVMVAVDESALPVARPGRSAQVRIDCGRRSLGYVWLHDIWDTLYRWFVF